MKYDLTLIPIEDGKPVIVNGRDYTTAAQRNHIVLNGNKYYVRQNHEGNVKDISGFLESPLEECTTSLTGLENIEFCLSPASKLGRIKITIEKSEDEE